MALSPLCIGLPKSQYQSLWALRNDDEEDDNDDGHDENADDGGDNDEFNCEYRCIVMFVPFALEVGCYCQGLCNSNGAPLSQLMTMMMMAMITMMMMAMVAMMTMITTYNPV